MTQRRIAPSECMDASQQSLPVTESSIATSKTFAGKPAAYSLVDDVVWFVADDGSSRLFDMNDFSYGLNETATRMMDGILNSSIDSAAGAVAAEFEADPAVIRKDIDDLVRKLVDAKLIVAGPYAGKGSPADRHRALGGAYSALFRGLISRLPIKAEAFATLTAVRSCLKLASLSETAAIIGRCVPAKPPVIDAAARDQAVSAVEAAVEASIVKHPIGMACKERALTCWYMLQRRGVPAEVVVGVTLHPVFGHSWCRAGDRIVADTNERCDDYTPIWRH